MSSEISRALPGGAVATDRHVLLIEDDESNGLTVGALLEDIGCTVEIATSLFAARAKLSHERYALVLLDHNLGDGTGPELLPQLLALRPPPRVVLLSGSPEQLGEPLGFDAIHAKGADPEELISTIRTLLKINT